MNSPWLDQVRACAWKEMRSEARSRHGLMTGMLFSVLTSVTLGYASILDKPSPALAAGMVASAMFFAASVTVPRLTLAEDEQGTLDLLRMRAEPSAAFLGKLAVASLQMLAMSAVMVLVLVGLIGSAAPNLVFLVAAVAGHALGLAAGLSFAAGLVAGASNRWILAAGVGIPLLLPQSILGVIAIRYGLGQGGFGQAVQCLAGLYGFALAMAALGVALAPALWGLSRRG